MTCEIRNLSLPELQKVPSGNIPSVQDEKHQVVAKLRRIGPAEVSIYHRGKQPTLEIGVQFRSKQTETEGFDNRTAVDARRDHRAVRFNILENGVLVFTEPVPERVINLNVPERWLYHQDVEESVRQQLFGKLPPGAVHINLKAGKRKNAYEYQLRPLPSSHP